MNTTNLWIFEEMKAHLEEIKSNKQYFRKPTDFSRNRTFTFETVFHLMMDLPCLSLSIEIEKKLPEINKLLGRNKSGTKSGFSKARDKIEPELFVEMNKKLLEKIYEKELSRWNGFLLKAVDGSIMDIINTEENSEEFGNHGGVVQGRMVICYDVLNKIITDSHLGKILEGESCAAKKWVKEMKSDELIIYDRLYPGMALQYYHYKYNSSYLMRCKSSHNKAIKTFVESKETDVVMQWPLTQRAIDEFRLNDIRYESKTTIPVRMIKVELETGETEILISSLIDQEKYPQKIFKELYFKRWGVETNIGFLKNTLQIEISSGQKSKFIYQNFFATILRCNIQTLIEQDCIPIIKQKTKKRKYKYAINKTVAAGNLKGSLHQLFLLEDPQKHYAKLIEIFAKNLEPIRPNRKFPRKRKNIKQSGKYRPFKNYKRAM